MSENGWLHCDIIMRYLSKKMREPEETLDLGEGEEYTLAPAMEFIPCAIEEKMPSDLALIKVRNYLLVNDPDLNDSDFSLEHGWHDHMMTEQPDDEKILYITPLGCTLGPPTK